MFYTIYKITNTKNGKIYIGKHQTNNLDDGYMGSGKLLPAAFEKHGIESFLKEFLFIFDSEDEMNLKEEEVVNEDFVMRDDTYNLTIGGSGSWYYANSTGKNIYETHAERSSENYRKAGDIHRIRMKTDQAYRSRFCLSLSKALKERYTRCIHYWVGKKHKEETKRKIGLKNSVHQAGDKNSQFGTMFITNESYTEEYKINKNDVIPSGWLKGRIKRRKIVDVDTKEITVIPINDAIPENKVLVKKPKETTVKRDTRTEVLQILTKFANGNFSSLREFVSTGNYSHSHVSLTKMLKKYAADLYVFNGKSYSSESARLAIQKAVSNGNDPFSLA